MRVDELALRRMLAEVAQQSARLGHGPSLYRTCMARKIEREPTGRGMTAHETLADGCPFLALLLREIGEAEDAAREELAVETNEVVDFALAGVVERVMGGAHIRELGVAAARRNAARRQDRIFGRHRLERAVGMPELVAEPEETAAIVARQHALVLVEVRDVVELHAEPPAGHFRRWPARGPRDSG